MFSSLLGVEGGSKGFFHTVQTMDDGSMFCVESHITPLKAIGALDLSLASPGTCAEEHNINGRWKQQGDEVVFSVHTTFYELSRGRAGTHQHNRRK